MNLEGLMLKKEEIPILHETCFHVPIHPKLLSSDIKIDENIARVVFSKAAKEWHDDLTKYSARLKDKDTRKQIDELFLKKKLKIKKEYGSQIVNGLGWKDDIFTLENGFVHSFSISRNAGGTLYFNKNDLNCKKFVSFDASFGYILLSKDKALEFGIKKEALESGDKGINAYVYASHNVDNYPAALFLRNWAILYLNEAMKLI